MGRELAPALAELKAWARPLAWSEPRPQRPPGPPAGPLACRHDGRPTTDRRRRQGARRRSADPLHPPLVHRHPRPAEVVLDQRRRARRRVRGRDGLRRLLDHRLQRDRGVGHDRHARPDDVHRAALAPGGRRRRRRAHVRRRPDARARALRGRPAPRAAPRRAARERRWASTTSSSAPSSSTSCSATTRATEVLDEGGYFDLTTLDAGSDVRRDTVLALEQLGIDVEYSHHEVGPSPARDRHALRRRAEDGRRLHDVPHHGQGVRAEVRLARDVHAQAAVRRERLGHAHAPVAVQGRPQRVLRRRRQVLPVRRRQGVHRRPAAPRARDLLDLRPVGELLQAARARATRRRSTSPGRAATAPRSCACRSTTPARSRRRGWSCAAPTRPATRT